MMKSFLIGGALLAVVAGAALAENAANNPPPPQDEMAQGPDGGPHGWWGPEHHKWRHLHGMVTGGPGGPGPMGGPPASGFHLTLGNGAEVGIMCGRQNLKDCIADAQPLIDAAKAAAPKPQ